MNIRIPSIKSLKRAVTKAFDKTVGTLDYGCHTREGVWHSYYVKDGQRYEVPTPKGFNARDFARAAARSHAGAASPSTSCTCENCAGTGKYRGTLKCFRCDGKGWMSPIDEARYAKYLARKQG